MNSFLANIGFFSICCLVIYIYKKVQDCCGLKEPSFYEDEKIYQAAEAFVHGASFDKVKVFFENSFDFDEKDIEKVMSLAIPHRTDKDGGYRAFIRSVNKVLGKRVYSERYHLH